MSQQTEHVFGHNAFETIEGQIVPPYVEPVDDLQNANATQGGTPQRIPGEKTAREEDLTKDPVTLDVILRTMLELQGKVDSMASRSSSRISRSRGGSEIPKPGILPTPTLVDIPLHSREPSQMDTNKLTLHVNEVEVPSVLPKPTRSPSENTLLGSTRLDQDMSLYMMRQRAPNEASKGQWFSELLSEVTLPDHWPTYSWPKNWKQRQDFTIALIALRDLQKQHKHDLLAALDSLKDTLRTSKRSFTWSEFQLIKEYIDHPEVKWPKSYEHVIWELCLRANTDLETWITDHLQACRTVAPVLIADSSAWIDLVRGGAMPISSSLGYKVVNQTKATKREGRKRKFNKKHFKGNSSTGNKSSN